MVANLQFLPGLSNSDHVILSFDLVCFSPPKLKASTRTCTNYEELNHHLSAVDWSQMYDMSLTEASGFFHQTVRSSIAACSVQKRPKPMKNIYINRKAWQLKKEKNRLWQIFTQSRDVLDHARFTRCRNQLRTLTRNLRRDYEQQLVSKIKLNPKAFCCIRDPDSAHVARLKTCPPRMAQQQAPTKRRPVHSVNTSRASSLLRVLVKCH